MDDSCGEEARGRERSKVAIEEEDKEGRGGGMTYEEK